MEQNILLLNDILKNCEMGVGTIRDILTIIDDEEFKKLLNSQMNEYSTIYEVASSKLKGLDAELKDVGVSQKAMSNIMIKLKTLTDKTPSHIAEMMMQGSAMGIIQITKKIKEFNDSSEFALNLAGKLLEFEERNFNELKRFL